MLKNITVIMQGKPIYTKNYAISFKTEGFLQEFLETISNEMAMRNYIDMENVLDLLTIKVLCYRKNHPTSIFVALTFDDSDDIHNSSSELHQIVDIIMEKGDNLEECSKEIDKVVDNLMKWRPAKISVVGYDFVGKTNVCNLITNGSVPEKYEETTTMEKLETNLFGINTFIWDISDDLMERMWNKIILRSDAAIIVCDSKEKSVQPTIEIIEKVIKIIPHAELLIVANKQDEEDAIPIIKLEERFGMKVFPFVAKDNSNAKQLQIQAAKLLEIIHEEIDYSTNNYVIERND